jgi:TetR/AcrR family transcriptional regulator
MVKLYGQFCGNADGGVVFSYLREKDQTEDGSRRVEILEAAMGEFLEKGWSGARMQSIADRAGINKTLLHYYFGSKQKLYERIFDAVLDFFFGSVFGAIRSEDSIETILETLIDVIIDGAARNPRLPMFLMQELSRGGVTVKVALKRVLEASDNPAPQIMLRKLEEAARNGCIKTMDPVQIMLTVIGSSLYFSMIEPILGELTRDTPWAERYERTSFIEQRKAAVRTMLLYGLLPEDRKPREGRRAE